MTVCITTDPSWLNLDHDWLLFSVTVSSYLMMIEHITGSTATGRVGCLTLLQCR